jgi:sec-independent protein translocase protein TatA
MNLAFIQGIGPLELAIVLVIVLLILGPKRLPGVGRSLGSGMREFKDAITSRHDKSDGDPEPVATLDSPAAEKRMAAAGERPLEGEVVPERR